MQRRCVCASALYSEKCCYAADPREAVPPETHCHCTLANQACFNSAVPGRWGKCSSHIRTSGGNILSVLWVSYGENFSIPGYPEESCPLRVHLSMLPIYSQKWSPRFCGITYSNVTLTKQWYSRGKTKILPYTPKHYTIIVLDAVLFDSG